MTKQIWLSIAVCAAGALGCRRSEPPTVRSGQGAEESEGREGRDPREPQPAQEVACGNALCALGEVCCNPSCGICTAPDGMCTQQFCNELTDAAAGEPLPPAPNASCETVRCPDGTTCRMIEVECVRAPCEPVPRCEDADAGAHE